MSGLEPFYQRLREQALALIPSDPPAPWGRGVYFHVGGLLEVGWDSQERIVIISTDGYSVNSPYGERIERNHDTDLTFAALSGTRLQWTNPSSGELVQVFGIYGGGGIASTSDSWRLELVTPEWPDYILVLWDPSAAQPGAARLGYFNGAHRIHIRGLAGEERGCGFSPSGKHFLMGASDGALVWSRP